MTSDYSNPENYYNRELSWLLFEERVLEEAKDRSYPLLDRLKFLSITSSNLDEFFMVRVASLKEMEHAGYEGLDISGRTPAMQLDEVSEFVHKLIVKQYDAYNNDVLVGLEKKNIKIVTRHEYLTQSEKEFVDKYFDEQVFPVLTPMIVNSDREFPIISNKSLNLGLIINKKGTSEKQFAFVQVPKSMERVITIGVKNSIVTLILLEEIIERNVYKLFSKYTVLSSSFFRVVRNADLTISQDECSDLIKEIEEQIKLRQWGEPIRLDVEKEISPVLLNHLAKVHGLSDKEVYLINGPLDLTFLSDIYDIESVGGHRNPVYEPVWPRSIAPGRSIIEQIAEKDILLFHPYESFKPVVDFIKEASEDENVLAIKQTLYRVGDNSQIVEALSQAAKNGKQVTVLVELKARFDEETNIGFARKLEKDGCHVIYGIPGLKTHCKITQVIRKENGVIKSYVHLGTGNYNNLTAKLYTDLGLFTANQAIGEDITAVFNLLAGGSDIEKLNAVSVAPMFLRNRFLQLINREKENAEHGKQAGIVAKINSLCDKEIIDALYDASKAGVKIELFVRGICCLKACVPGLSENITVKSIVGNFLEHSRIFMFGNDGNPEVFCASSDWMPRNFDRRIELLFPIYDDDVKSRIMSIIEAMQKDVRKVRIMQPDGSYQLRPSTDENDYSYQLAMMKEINSL